MGGLLLEQAGGPIPAGWPPGQWQNGRREGSAGSLKHEGSRVILPRKVGGDNRPPHAGGEATCPKAPTLIWSSVGKRGSGTSSPSSPARATPWAGPPTTTSCSRTTAVAGT